MRGQARSRSRHHVARPPLGSFKDLAIGLAIPLVLRRQAIEKCTDSGRVSAARPKGTGGVRPGGACPSPGP